MSASEDARVVRALVVGGAVGMTFWVGCYSLSRWVIDHFRR